MIELQGDLFGACPHGVPKSRQCMDCVLAPLGAVPPVKFSGGTYSSEFDKVRLGSMLRQVFDLMRDGEWRTLADIRDEIGRGSEAGISARLRDLRKERFGEHTVEHRRVEGEDGLWEYRLTVNARVGGSG